MKLQPEQSSSVMEQMILLKLHSDYQEMMPVNSFRFMLRKKFYHTDPFEAIDQTGVGQLVEIGTRKGRSVRKDLKVGICGEHGGEPSSVEFCHRTGLNYVSCSPFRVPIARLAAARAVINEKKSKKSIKKSSSKKKK